MNYYILIIPREKGTDDLEIICKKPPPYQLGAVFL